MQAELDDQYAKIEGTPNFKVAQRDYRRGVFSSTETVTFELMGDTMASAAAIAGLDEAPEPIRVTLRSDIKHGPFPGFSALAVASAETVLVLDEAQQRAAEKLFGNQPPLALHTRYGFDGGQSVLTSPPFDGVVGEGAEGDEVRLASDGLNVTIDFSKGMSQYALKLTAGRLEMIEGEKTLLLSGLKADGKFERPFEDFPLFYIGSSRFTAERLQLTEPESGATLSLSQFEYRDDSRKEGDFLDMTAKIGAQSLLIGDAEWGPVHFDQRFNHLEARAAAKLFDGLYRIYSDPAVIAEAGNAVAGGAFESIAEPAGTLLANAPEYVVDRLTFAGPYGESLLSLRLTVPDATADEVANPLALLQKLVVESKVEVPEALLQAQLVDSDAGADAEAMAKQMLDDMLAGFVGDGYLTRQGGKVATAAAFKGGVLQLNGLPFDPTMLMGGPASAFEAVPDDEVLEGEYWFEEDESADSEAE